MASPTLGVEEYQFDDTGVLLNGSSDLLPFVDITSIEGLDNAPTRQQIHDMEGQDGGYVDSEFETIRTITIEGVMYADPLGVDTFLDTMKGNFAPHTSPKPFYIGGDLEQRVVFAKSQGLRFTKERKRGTGAIDFQVQLMCEDPRIYTDLLVEQSAARSAGSMSINLSGNRPTPAVITITGPISAPSITYTRTGTVMSFTGYTLGTGESLVIDLSNRTVIQGSSSRRSKMTLTGTWFQLVAGTNTFQFGGTGSTATFAVEARSAWR